MSAGTPVEVWAPAFAWLDRLTAETTQAVFSDGPWCRLCERQLNHVGPGGREAHVREHRHERERWQRGRRRQVERAARERLRLLNRERAMERRVLGEGRALRAA